MARKPVRKNYYKNSPARRRERLIRRFVVSMKITCLLVAMGGASLFFILCHDALMQSSCFKASEIVVEGNRRLSKETILKEAQVRPGDSILEINLKVLRYRLMANPWITAADVWRELPDKIHIRVTERVPIAKIALDRAFYLDGTGQIVAPVKASDEINVPLVTGLTLADTDRDNQGESKVFAAVMRVLRLSRLHGGVLPVHMLHRIHADTDTGLTLFAFDCNVTINLGFEDYTAKFHRLGELMSHFKQAGKALNIEYIHLKDVGRVVVRPSEGGSALKVCCRKEV
ncbi:MAG: FtsQ-type POTRA domain-containing protein [Thermodesulfobacteriota bacterium]|nr:FtsQ-type POTRA domain-containing protein [Thermodesulfobacteriota bacterium]